MFNSIMIGLSDIKAIGGRLDLRDFTMMAQSLPPACLE